MSRPKALNASTLVAILIFGFFARLLAEIWLGVIVCGTAVVLVWLRWVLVRKERLSTTTVHEPPRALLPIDSKVFDDPATTKEAALKVFSTWARQLPAAPENPAELVQSLEPRVHHLGRLVTTIAERKLLWRQAPHGQASRVTDPKLAPEDVDPWAVSLPVLKNSSLYIVACELCAGQGTRPCPTCRGALSVQCSHCKGQRKAYGYAKNGSWRLMNCKHCGAKGALPCATCKTGQLPCSTCRGTGRAERWLEFEEASRSDVQVAMESEELREFSWATQGPKASPAALEADAMLLGEVTSQGALSQAKAARLAPDDWLHENWKKLQFSIGPRERVQSQSLQVFKLPILHLSYALAGAPPTAIRIQGRRMLVPPATVDRQFAELAQKLRLARRAILALAIGIPVAYLLRGFYFWGAWVGAMTLCLAGSAVAADRFVRERILSKRNDRRWGLLAASAATLATILAVGAEPSVRSAERQLSAGRLDAARKELVALGHPDKPSHARAWVALHLAQVLQGTEVAAVAQEAAQLPEGSAERATANQHLYELTQAAVLQHLTQKDPAAAKGVLAKAEPVLQKSASGKPSAEQLGELNARIHEAEYEACTTDACRWISASETQQAAPSTEREQRLAKARAALVDRLTPSPRPKEVTQAWVQRLDDTTTLASTISKASGDADLHSRAQQAQTWAQEERRKIPLVGADRAVVAGLLRISPGGDTNTLTTVTTSVTLYCAMKEDHCAGVYLVGSDRSTRVLNDSTHAAATLEFLSQALGHPSTLPEPPKRVGGKVPTTSTWKDGSVTLVARWNETNLVELRLGDAKP